MAISVEIILISSFMTSQFVKKASFALDRIKVVYFKKVIECMQWARLSNPLFHFHCINK